MSGAVGRLALFALGLGALFAVALGVGQAWGPTIVVADEHGGGGSHTAEKSEAPGGATGHGGDQEAASTSRDIPGGLTLSQDGYGLKLASTAASAGDDVPLSFTVHGPDASPVTKFDVEHGKRLHLIAVRRDLSGYQHVHPSLDTTTGQWSTELDLTPGIWKVFADFAATGGPSLTLGSDLIVPGSFEPVATEQSGPPVDQVGDYEVELDGELVAGEDAELTLRVSRNGEPVTDLQPYLGANGHLVALRDGDLAYLHVHPHESTTAGPAIRFTAEVPSDGHFRLFLDFKHADRVRTASFDVTVEP